MATTESPFGAIPFDLGGGASSVRAADNTRRRLGSMLVILSMMVVAVAFAVGMIVQAATPPWLAVMCAATFLAASLALHLVLQRNNELNTLRQSVHQKTKADRASATSSEPNLHTPAPAPLWTQAELSGSQRRVPPALAGAPSLSPAPASVLDTNLGMGAETNSAPGAVVTAHVERGSRDPINTKLPPLPIRSGIRDGGPVVPPVIAEGEGAKPAQQRSQPDSSALETVLKRLADDMAETRLRPEQSAAAGAASAPEPSASHLARDAHGATGSVSPAIAVQPSGTAAANGGETKHPRLSGLAGVAPSRPRLIPTPADLTKPKPVAASNAEAGSSGFPPLQGSIGEPSRTSSSQASNAPAAKPDQILAAVMDALASERIGLYLEAILGVETGAPKHFEVSVRLDPDAAQPLDRDDYLDAVRGTGLLPLIDTVKVSRTRALMMQQRPDVSVGKFISVVEGESLASDQFRQDFDAIATPVAGFSDRLVLTFRQRELRIFSATQWLALDRLAEQGFRFGVDEIDSLDMDFSELVERGFAFARVDAEVFLEGMPVEDGRLPPNEICRHLTDSGLSLVVGRITTPAQRAAVVGFGVKLVQGSMFGAPRPIRYVARSAAVNDQSAHVSLQA